MPRYKLRTPWYYRLPWYLLMAAATWAGFRFGHDVLPQRQAHAEQDAAPPPAAASAAVTSKISGPFTQMRDWLATVHAMDAATLAAEWQKAEQAAAALEAGPVERARAELLLDTWAQRDPAAAHAQLIKDRQTSAARRVLQRWAARDGSAAFANAAAGSDPGDRAAVWLAMAERQPDEAVKLLDDPANARILTQLAGQLPPAEMTALLTRLPAGHAAVQEALQSPALSNTGGSAPLEGEAARQRDRLEEALRRTGPEAAAALAVEMRPEAQSWLALQIPAGLLPAFTRDAAGRGWNALLPAFVRRWAGFDATAAEAFIAVTGTAPVKEAMTSALWEGLFAGLPERLAERAARPESVPAALLPRAVERLARTAPATALALFSRLPEASRTEDLINLLAGQLAEDDPRAAGKWVIETLPEVRQGAPMRKIVAAWVEQDPLRAAEWITDLPLGQAHDHAVAELAMKFLRMEDKVSAEAWAHLVTDNGLRASLLQQIAPPPSAAADDAGDSEHAATKVSEDAPISAKPAGSSESPDR